MQSAICDPADSDSSLKLFFGQKEDAEGLSGMPGVQIALTMAVSFSAICE